MTVSATAYSAINSGLKMLYTKGKKTKQSNLIRGGFPISVFKFPALKFSCTSSYSPRLIGGWWGGLTLLPSLPARHTSPTGWRQKNPHTTQSVN